MGHFETIRGPQIGHPCRLNISTNFFGSKEVKQNRLSYSEFSVTTSFERNSRKQNSRFW